MMQVDTQGEAAEKLHILAGLRPDLESASP